MRTSARIAKARAARAGGFTLIEILVALAVFATLSALAYGGLGAVVRARQVLAEESESLGRLQFAIGLLERDLRSVVERPVRDAYGGETAVLQGSRSALELTRVGAGLGTFSGAPAVERVAYRVEGLRFERRRWAVLDRAPGSQPIARTLLADGDSVEFRYLDDGARWHSQWPPPAGGVTGLPRAVELRLRDASLGEVRRLWALPDARP